MYIFLILLVGISVAPVLLCFLTYINLYLYIHIYIYISIYINKHNKTDALKITTSKISFVRKTTISHVSTRSGTHKEVKV